MLITISLIVVALLFCAMGAFWFLKANYCACHRQGQCDNPVTHYWLAAMLCQMVSFASCCIALHTVYGTLLWMVLITSCMGGVLLGARLSNKQTCTKAANALLVGEIN